MSSSLEKLIVRGGKPLRGEISVSGSKNATLPIIAATLLAEGEHILRNVPLLSDVDAFSTLLTILGAKVKHNDSRELIIENLGDKSLSHAPYDVVSRMRASILVLGPLLACRGTADVSLPGGCSIGARPIDLHLKALEAMGAKIQIDHGYIKGSVDGRLRGADITFDKVTVTGTANILMAATLAVGTTTIRNAAMEPEVEDLCQFLITMGAKIIGSGTNTLIIEGVETLTPSDYTVMSDRIEAGTIFCVIAAAGGNVLVENVPIHTMDAVIQKLQAMGISIHIEDDSQGLVRVESSGRLKSLDLDTSPYPGTPTDMQAQIMALLSISQGVSVITENIFENRFMHVPELNRMGADIHATETTAFITGVEKLSGAPVQATDLRAAAALLIAALAADGVTEIHNIYHLDRGYERFDKRLASLGAIITREIDV